MLIQRDAAVLGTGLCPLLCCARFYHTLAIEMLPIRRMYTMLKLTITGRSRVTVRVGFLGQILSDAQTL